MANRIPELWRAKRQGPHEITLEYTNKDKTELIAKGEPLRDLTLLLLSMLPRHDRDYVIGKVARAGGAP
jgi:hypothetical protein